jgi:hypothetical protein
MTALASRQHDHHREGTILFGTKLLAVAGAVAAITALATTAAAASVTPSAAKNVTGIQAGSVGCTLSTCVVVGMDTAGTAGKAALINPATGAVKLGRGTLAVDYGAADGIVACPNKATCLSEAYGGNHDQNSEITAISTKTGAQKVTATLPANDQYSLSDLACPSSKYCYAVGNSAAPGVQLPTWALLLKVSPAGKILTKTINKSYYGYGPIACESTSACLVGRETTRLGFQAVPLVNGKFGKSHALPSNFLPFTFSCYTTKLCYAEGITETSNAPEVVPLNPKTGAPGKVSRLPLADTGSVSLGLACYSSTQCVAVGEITKGTGINQTTEAAYLVINKGKAGKAVVASTEESSAFTAVSCASSKECYAVGTYFVPDSNYEPTITDKV